MNLTNEQLMLFDRDGFVLIPSYFSSEEIVSMKEELPALFGQDAPSRISEANGRAVRSIYGSHKAIDRFWRLCRLSRLVEPAMQLVKDQVYVYQFKVNAKAAFAGEVWEWHQDFVFWQREDGMTEPRVVNTAIFLDDVNEFNGPIYVIPGSHLEGVIESMPSRAAERQNGTGWLSDVGAKLRYSLAPEIVTELVRKRGLKSLKGPAGSTLFFDSNLAHASPNNISPFNRALILITYNSIQNIPMSGPTTRPEFLVGTDYQALLPLAGDLV